VLQLEQQMEPEELTMMSENMRREDTFKYVNMSEKRLRGTWSYNQGHWGPLVPPPLMLFSKPMKCPTRTNCVSVCYFHSQWLDPLQCLPVTSDPPNGRWRPPPPPDSRPFSGPSPGGRW